MHAVQDSHNMFAYPGFLYPNTHPDRLAAMAILHGLSPAPVEQCRVLEIGCNEGANLIPMAYAIPTSEFAGFDLARLRIERGQARMHFLLESRLRDDAYRLLIQEQLDQVEKRSPELTFHDWLTDEYHPVLFTEFVEHARKHGMQYLSEAALPPMNEPWYRSEIRSAIEGAAGGDILKQEQMLDFMRTRMFRETLPCRAERVVRRDFPAQHLRRLFLASQATSAA